MKKPPNNQASVSPAAETEEAVDSVHHSGIVQRLVKSRTFIVVMVLLIASVPTFYFYKKSQSVEKRLNDPDTANQQVIYAVVKKVGKLILLPTGEKPTLASVSDVNKVKDQPFFTNARNGDKVLVYTQARKAILYRPSQNLIIEVAPLNVGSVNSSSLNK